MTTPISRAAVLAILRTPAASDTFPDMIRRVEALEGCGVKERKTFPILKGEGASIDYQLVADHAEQARANHYQSVGRLAERGGLSWCELYAVLHNRKWEKMADNDAMITCRALEARYLAALEPVAQPEPGLIATYPHPGYGKLYPIQTVLRDLASQEGCDGEPYDAMMFAAKTIDDMRADRQALVRSTLERAARVAKHRHEVWAAGDGFWDADGLPAVECDVTACDNIADAILALRTAPQPVSEYERKVAQMKEDFPNGI